MSDIPNTPINTDDYRLPTILIIPVIQVMAAVFLFIALLNGHRELTVLLLVVISIVAGVKVWRKLSPAGIACDITLDRRRVFPGEQLLLSARIKNAKLLPVLADISPSFAKALQSADNSESLQKGCSLLWFQEAVFKWPLTAAQRGVYRIGTAELKVGDIFGFYTNRINTESAIDVIVYPRLIKLKSFRLPRLELFGTPGIQSPIEDPVYVYGTREYQSGRPARYIHWKASARLSRLQERICEPAAQEKVLLTIDVGCFNQNQAHQDFERMLEVAGSLAVNLDRDGIAVGLATNGALKGGGSSIVPIGRGREQIPSILETLARLSIKSEIDLRRLLIRSLRLPYGTTIVNLAHDSGQSCSDILAFLRHRRRPAVTIVCHGAPPIQGHRNPRMAGMLSIEDICGGKVQGFRGSG